MIEKIIAEIKKNKFKPIYWLEGEEDYYIDQLIDYAETSILTEAEAEFNLSVFYGKDASWTDIVNACRRYPMFAERQVIILKEAQQMRDVDSLLSYVENPSASTLLFVSYKGKKLDGKKKLAKAIKQHALVLTTKKMYERELPAWAGALIQAKGYQIKPRALSLLTDHIGNDLNRIANEIDKVLINLGKEKEITEDHIEMYVGISKEYNAFELSEALGRKDLMKAMKIIQYFERNPKAGPIQLVLGAVYNHFSKIYAVYGMNDKSRETLSPLFLYNPIAIKSATDTLVNYDFRAVEKTLMLVHDYNLKSLGVNIADVSDASLLKEMVYKIIYD